MNADSPLAMLRSMYETCKRPVPRELVAMQIPVLHETLSIRSQEIQRIQDTGTEESEGQELFRSQPAGSVSSSTMLLDEAAFRQSMLLSARRAAPWAKALNAYKERDRQCNGGKYEFAIELIEKMIREQEAKDLATLVAEELQSLNIDAVGANGGRRLHFRTVARHFGSPVPASHHPISGRLMR